MAASALNNAQVHSTTGGIFYSAPVGSTAPSDALTAPATAFTNLGYTSSDGLKYTPNNKSNDVFAMQNGGVEIMCSITEASEEYAFTPLQINAATIGISFGTTVTQTTTSGSYVTNPGAMNIQRAFIFDVTTESGIERIYIPRAILLKPPEQDFVTGNPQKLPWTLKAFSDSTINGFSQRWNTMLATGAP